VPRWLKTGLGDHTAAVLPAGSRALFALVAVLSYFFATYKVELQEEKEQDHCKHCNHCTAAILLRLTGNA
jgi:hypothetical protein